MLSQSDFLEKVWSEIINPDPKGGWIGACIEECRTRPDSPFADAGPVLQRMLDAGVTMTDLGLLARWISYEACFQLITLFEDPGLEDGESDGMHESILEADPSGLEGRPGSWPIRRPRGRKETGALRTTPGKSFSLAFSPDGMRIAAAYRGQIWDVATLSAVAKCNLAGNTTRVTFSPDGRLLAGINTSGKVAVCGAETGSRKLAFDIDGEGDALAFSLDGRLIAAGNRDVIVIFDCITSEIVKRLNESAASWLRFDETGLLLACSGHVCRHYDLETAAEVAVMEFPRDVCGSTGQDRFIELRLDPTDTRRGLLFQTSGARPCRAAVVHLDKKRTSASRELDLSEAAFSPDGTLIAAVRKFGSAPDAFLLLDGESLETLWEMPAQYPNDVAFSADGRRLALATWNKGWIADVTMLPLRRTKR